MKLEQSFDVKAPIDTVWTTLIDVERVAPCLPGAEITGSEDGVFQGNFQVKIGPTTAAYRGTLEMQSLDEAGHIATMRARGQDKRGQGSANATIVSTLSETAEGTHVDVVTDFTITGTLARFGRGGMMQDIANRLMRDFATCLEKRIAPGEPAAEAPAGAATPEPGEVAAGVEAAAPATPQESTPPVRAISLFFSVLWERIKRFFARLFGQGS
jgi:carbon monoxide dehydrogenase subunit G